MQAVGVGVSHSQPSLECGICHLQPCCHMLIVLYSSSFPVDVIFYSASRMELSKVKNFLLKWEHLKAEEYFSPPVSVFPCHAKNSP